jgi:hypothetical protein
LIKDSKIRGAVTTIISGSVSGLSHMLGLYFGFSPHATSIVAVYVFGSIVAYILDIMFAKNMFRTSSNKLLSIPYTDFTFRFKWLLKSFTTSVFFRFVITMLIDTFIGLMIIHHVIKYLDKKDIHFNFRDTIVTGLVAVFTFILYNNSLRFEWAYVEDKNTILDMIVFMWVSLVLVLYVLFYQNTMR